LIPLLIFIDWTVKIVKKVDLKERTGLQMEEIKRIEDQLRRAFEGDAWHGPSVRNLLEDVTNEMAAARPLASAHNIWEIVLHIAAWEGAVRRMLEGEVVKLSAEEDWPPVKDTSEAAWRDSLEALEKGHKQLRMAISHLTDSQLDNIVASQKYSVYFVLHGLIQHDLYHAGQIALLKKAWKVEAK
jgi:uncharacterized damage-inducible protein DinB